MRAAEADSGVQEESFLEQARRHIAEGKLRTSGFRFSVTWKRRGWPLPPPSECPPLLLDERKFPPWEDKTESPDRVEIAPLAMADHRLIFVGPEFDCQVVQGGDFAYWGAKGATAYSVTMSGWKDVRGVAGDIERLWPRTSAHGAIGSSRGAYEPGKRAQNALAKCFPNGIPSRVDVPDGELVRRVQAKHSELCSTAPAPDPKTILRHACRQSRRG